MKQRFVMRVSVAAALVMMAASIPLLAGGAMKMTAVSFPVPPEGETIPLSGLTYGGAGGTVAVTTARLDVVSGEGESPVRTQWTLGASNTKPQARRAQLQIFLIDGKEKRIASTRAKVLIRGNDEEQRFVLELDVKDDVWARAEKVYLRVDFLNQ